MAKKTTPSEIEAIRRNVRKVMKSKLGRDVNVTDCPAGLRFELKKGDSDKVMSTIRAKDPSVKWRTTQNILNGVYESGRSSRTGIVYRVATNVAVLVLP